VNGRGGQPCSGDIASHSFCAEATVSKITMVEHFDSFVLGQYRNALSESKYRKKFVSINVCFRSGAEILLPNRQSSPVGLLLPRNAQLKFDIFAVLQNFVNQVIA
jgi:hypothetical protein